MAVRPLEPKSSASASSATFAGALKTACLRPRLGGVARGSVTFRISGQETGEFLKARAADQPRRGISAGADLVFQR